jgi:hypothetical protein
VGFPLTFSAQRKWEEGSLSDLGQHDNLLTGQIELFDGLAKYDLRGAIRVHLPMDDESMMTMVMAVMIDGSRRHRREVKKWIAVLDSRLRCRRSGFPVRN